MFFRRFKNEKGVSLIEFTILFPVLIIFVAGVINFAFGMRTVTSLNSAARHGARTISQRSADEGAVPCADATHRGKTCSELLALPAATIESDASLELFGMLGACEFMERSLSDDDLDNWDIEVTYRDDPDIVLLVTDPPAESRTAIVQIVRKEDADPTGRYCIVCFDDFALTSEKVFARSNFLLEGACT